ncbi:signal peptidase II [Actinopolyspora halophila]|uniref:signal peptidase II n=1 Tax=Actinopolyspora halophila TaxID=1850 RepID=UPI00052677BA|nr:signal peptidase II [Actinopolyspora halophila]
MTRTESPVDRVARRRATLSTGTAVLAATDLIVKAWAGHALAAGHTIGLGMLQLRLGYNPGVAFSLGARLPHGIVLTVTAVITAAIAIYAWYQARTATTMMLAGLTAVLGGALANLVDRGVDGVVTDYLHTGWFPTFNLADVFITGGGALLILASLRATPPSPDRSESGAP